MSFFKAPKWAKAQSTNDDDDEQSEADLFSHSKDFMAVQQDRLDQEMRKKQRSQRKEQEREQRRKDKLAEKVSKPAIKHASPGAESSTEPVKKRRITSEESAKLLKSVGVQPIDIVSNDEDEQIRYDVEEALHVRLSPRAQRTRCVLADGRTRSNLSIPANTGGDLDTASGTDIAQATTTHSPEPEEDEDSDEEIAALQRIARERHKRKKQMEEAQKSTAPGAAGSNGDAYSGLCAPSPPDPVISLFITSDIPNTTELLIKRKLTQDLGAARRAWCKKCGLTDEFSDTVFFTWCGRRMYDVTTCQRLGLEVDAAGNVVRADERDRDGAAQVHVIATTQERLDQEKAEQLRQAKLDSAVYDPEEAAAPEQEDIARKEVKIIVKAKDAPVVPVKVFSTTKICKIVNYAKKRMNIALDQPAYLTFDGERLDPEGEVGDTEIEDMDNVDLLLGD